MLHGTFLESGRTFELQEIDDDKQTSNHQTNTSITSLMAFMQRRYFFLLFPQKKSVLFLPAKPNHSINTLSFAMHRDGVVCVRALFPKPKMLCYLIDIET